jgi:hypothetical protein
MPNCPKCGRENPNQTRFCFECGTSLSVELKPKEVICTTCGINIDGSYLFCPNCGQSLVKKTQTSIITHDVLKIPKIAEDRIECPSCGQLTAGEYCNNCGYHIVTQKFKRPIDYWYCPRDSAIMNEINLQLQFPISRKTMDESLSQAMEKKLLPHHEREKVRNLAQQLMEESESNFVIISNVQCPICGQQTFAPATIRPKEELRQYLPYYTLNGGAILRSGMDYFRNHPTLLVIVVLTILFDFGSFLLGLNISSLRIFCINISPKFFPLLVLH